MTIYPVDIQPTSLANKIEMTYQHMAKEEELKGGIQRNLAADAKKTKTISHTAAYSATREEFDVIAADFGNGLEAIVLKDKGIDAGLEFASTFDYSNLDYNIEYQRTVRYPKKKSGNLFGGKVVGNIELETIYHPKNGAKFFKNSVKQNLHILIEE